MGRRQVDHFIRLGEYPDIGFYFPDLLHPGKVEHRVLRVGMLQVPGGYAHVSISLG